MRNTSFPAFVSASLLLAVAPAMAQSFQPKSIVFKGAPEYSDQELMTAAGLKKGMTLSNAEMGDHAKALMDTGMFANMSYKFDGLALTFALTPTDQLYPVRLENLPLAAGPDLDARLHERLPLYHGKVPADGGMVDGVKSALQQMLAAEGLQVTLTVAPSGQAGTRMVNAMSFSIASPAVRASVVKMEGVEEADQARIHEMVAKAASNPFDRENAATNLSRPVEGYYQDRGHAEAKVTVTPAGKAAMDGDAILVPFAMHVEPGPVYKLGAVHLPDGALVTAATVDKILAPRPGGPVDGIRVRALWGAIAQAYQSKGYLDCRVNPHPQIDQQAGIVNYAVEVVPGPVYHLAFVKFDNVSDQLRALLLKDWQMLPGDPFDPLYVSMFIVKAQQSDPVLQRTLAGIKTSFDVNADPQTHEVNVVIRLAK